MFDPVEQVTVPVTREIGTIRDTDRIFVLDGGRIRQSGTFAELMQQEGLFQRLAQRQMA